MKILITGASGFIGSHLVETLQSEHEVFAVTRRYPSDGTTDRAHWIEQDFTRSLDYSRLPKAVDIIIHLAQSSFYKDFPDQANDIFRVNVESTFELLEYARKAEAKRFIFASTGGIYGYSKRPFVETDPVQLLGFYFSSKYIAELMIQDYRQFFDTIIVRPFFVYGAGQKANMFIPRLVRNILLGEPITLSGAEGVHLNPIYVDDAVEALMAAQVTKGHHLINIGGARVLSLREIAVTIGKHLNQKPLFKHVDSGEDHIVADISRMKEFLGSPKVDFGEGVLEVCREVERILSESAVQKEII